MSRDTIQNEGEIIESNLGLVHRVAREFRGRGVPFEDLVQEGTVGLVQAVRRFDPAQGVAFSTFGVWWIRRAMIDALGNMSAIRIPARARRELAAVRRVEAELRPRPGDAPRSEAIASQTGLSAGRVVALRGAAHVTASLHQPIGEDGTQLADLIPDPDAVDPSNVVDERETRRQLWSLLRLLPPRHREVVIRRYGLVGDRSQAHAEIAGALGVGEERSRQLEREALHRLRQLEPGRQLAA